MKTLLAKPEKNHKFKDLINFVKFTGQVVNAEQFVLPKELESSESLPFSWKWRDERQDDFDANPKLCFNCQKSSRKIPTIACDFCPAVFHLDCLDPPLCEVPKVSNPVMKKDVSC